jgi:hypothetical protein
MVNKIKTSLRTIRFANLFLKIISVLFLFFLFSCNNDETINKVIEQSIDLQVENEKFRIENESFATNEVCNSISVSFIYDKGKDNPHFMFELSITKKGVIRKISYTRFGESTNPFDSPDFNPSGLLSIKNFEYDETKKFLHFEFSGELIEVESNFASLDVPQKRKKISGEVTVNKVIDNPCDSFVNDLSFETNTLKFSTFRSSGSHIPSLATNPYQFIFNSENGYRLYIKSNNDLWNLSKGTYTFDQNTIETRIDIEKYIGIFRASQTLYVRSQDFKKYQTSGSYTILEHVIINGAKVTKGIMNFQVFDNGVLQHNITNAKFEVAGFN